MTDDARPSLRDENRARTRGALVAAAAELVRETGSTDVALTAVATRAGVGERTLYRYFPTKHELLSAVFDHLTDGASELPPVQGADALVDRAALYFAAFEQQPELTRALVVAPPGESRRSRAAARRAGVAAALEQEVAGLAEPRRTQVMAVVHLLTSSDAFLHARDFWDLDAQGVADLVRWAVRALLEGVDVDGEAGT